MFKGFDKVPAQQIERMINKPGGTWRYVRVQFTFRDGTTEDVESYGLVEYYVCRRSHQLMSSQNAEDHGGYIGTARTAELGLANCVDVHIVNQERWETDDL